MKKMLALTLGVSLALGVAGGVSAANDTYSTTVHGQVSASAPNWQWYGTKLDAADLTIAGVPMGVTMNEVHKSLGTPKATTYWSTPSMRMTANNNDTMSYSNQYGNKGIRSLTYGGITYSGVTGQSKVSYVTLDNRDATTARGIAVGDSLEQVYKAYGQPVLTGVHIGSPNSDEGWFYGDFYKGSEQVRGIYFLHKNDKVTEIVLVNNID